MYKQIILKPRMSEKAYGQSQMSNTYVFDVPNDVNKHSVAHAVEMQYEVVVKSVNVANIPGKAKRTVYKGGKAVAGHQSDFKKAYVTLAEGNTLPIFAAIEEEDAKVEATQVKVDKAAAKVADKAAKKTAKEKK
ncbi:50S ribosomal protein L23 [Aeromicrobium sp.]|nr:50S ribosomal protein L23 [Candidatus Saccharibacteria bacterium]